MNKTLQMCIQSQCLLIKIWQKEKKNPSVSIVTSVLQSPKGRQIYKCVHNSQKAFSSKTWKYTQSLVPAHWLYFDVLLVLHLCCGKSVNAVCGGFCVFCIVVCALTLKKSFSMRVKLLHWAYHCSWHCDMRSGELCDHIKSFELLSSEFLMNGINPH